MDGGEQACRGVLIEEIETNDIVKRTLAERLQHPVGWDEIDTPRHPSWSFSSWIERHSRDWVLAARELCQCSSEITTTAAKFEDAIAWQQMDHVPEALRP